MGKKFLIIQTAFIGDVVLATPMAEVLKQQFPNAEVHLLIRKGNESLLDNHPYIDQVFIWRKKEGKYRQLFKTIREIRQHHYDTVYNLQRFFSSGLVTALAKAKQKVGFDKNPLAFTFNRKVFHKIPAIENGRALHEVERNLRLLENPPFKTPRPTLFPSDQDKKIAQSIAGDRPYFVIAPASVWFTKQWPMEKWQELMKRLPLSHSVLLVGAPGEKSLAEQLLDSHPKAINLCGELSMLQTVALMENAQRVFTNDSAPLHFASAANASHTAIFCSTVPAFGFGPLSENARIAETNIDLSCRPCGLHGRKACPLKHFKCAHSISATQVFNGMEYYKAIKRSSDEKALNQVANFFLGKKQMIGLHFGNMDLVVAPFSKYEEIIQLEPGNSPVLVINKPTVLNYFVKEIPPAIFDLLDEKPEDDLVFNFPSINPPVEDMEERFQLPILLTRNREINDLLANLDTGVILALPLSQRIDSTETISNKLSFYMPLRSQFQLNKALKFRVTHEGGVQVDK